jgi:hypothetical protein
MTSPYMTFHGFVDACHEIARQEIEAARKKKSIDRIAWRAEAQQRRDKGMHFK